MAYIRRKQVEGTINLAAMGKVMEESKHDRISPEAMLLRMGGL